MVACSSSAKYTSYAILKQVCVRCMITSQFKSAVASCLISSPLEVSARIVCMCLKASGHASKLQMLDTSTTGNAGAQPWWGFVQVYPTFWCSDQTRLSIKALGDSADLVDSRSVYEFVQPELCFFGHNLCAQGRLCRSPHSRDCAALCRKDPCAQNLGSCQ